MVKQKNMIKQKLNYIILELCFLIKITLNDSRLEIKKQCQDLY